MTVPCWQTARRRRRRPRPLDCRAGTSRLCPSARWAGRSGPEGHRDTDVDAIFSNIHTDRKRIPSPPPLTSCLGSSANLWMTYFSSLGKTTEKQTSAHAESHRVNKEDRDTYFVNLAWARALRGWGGWGVGRTQTDVRDRKIWNGGEASFQLQWWHADDTDSRVAGEQRACYIFRLQQTVWELIVPLRKLASCSVSLCYWSRSYSLYSSSIQVLLRHRCRTRHFSCLKKK